MFGLKKSAKARSREAQRHQQRYTVTVRSDLPPRFGESSVAEVTDLYNGNTVYRGTEEEANAYADQWNRGNPQQFLAWQQLANAILEQELKDHPRPWRFESHQQGGANVISGDDYLIVTLESAEMAEWVVKMVNDSK